MTKTTTKTITTPDNMLAHSRPAKIAFHIFQFGVYDRQRRFTNLTDAKNAVVKQAFAQMKRNWYGEWKKVGVNKYAYNVHNSKGTVQFTIGLTKKGN